MKQDRTLSEHLFEELCRGVGIGFQRIEEAESQRPDYEVMLGEHRVVAEVKQFDPNNEEAESIRRLMAGGVGGSTATPGQRIRKALDSAAPQLKALSKGECPAIVIVYDNSGSGHTDPYFVATAMQGLDVVPVVVPKDASISPHFQDVRSGPRKRMTAIHNTAISAIGVLLIGLDRHAQLRIYHNHHARHPIEPQWLRHPLVHHFRLPSGSTSSIVGWENV